MQYPHEKTLNPLVPALFIEAIQDRLRSYDGTRLRKPRPCPDCGDQNYRKHNIEEQIFAVLITEDGFEEVTVEYRRYWCKNCEKPALPDMSPLFYENCHYGKPIVDLCLFHAAENPFHASERILQNQYGIQVDRDTIQRYAERFGDEVTVNDEYPMHGPVKGEVTNTRVETTLVGLPPDEDYDKYQAFLTNLAVNVEIGLDRRQTHKRIKRYTRRGGIETAYSKIKEFAPWTTSKDFSVRLFHFGFAVLLYDLWLLVDFLVQVSLGIVEFRPKPRVTAPRFCGFLRRRVIALL